MDDNTMICPGCGLRCVESELICVAEFKRCPHCEYENGVAPHRLLTVKELIEFPLGQVWHNVDLYEFLNEALPILAAIYEERKSQ
jgi:hypothetical protein